VITKLPEFSFSVMIGMRPGLLRLGVSSRPLFEFGLGFEMLVIFCLQLSHTHGRRKDKKPLELGAFLDVEGSLQTEQCS